MNNKKNRVVFICVNYNGYGDTVKYISNIQSFKTDLKLNVIVVDNSNTENDYIKLKEFIKEKEFDSNTNIIHMKNEGYFQGLNKGIELVKENKWNPIYTIVGNNDITFREDFLDVLCSIEPKRNELIIAPDVITNDGCHENPHIKYRIGKLKSMAYDIYYSNYNIAKIINLFYKTNKRKIKPYNSIRQEIYQGIGAVYILTEHFINQFNGLWEKVFLYCEEAIISYQVKSVNGKIIYEPDLKCYHNESSSTSKLNKRTKYELYRKSYKIARKYI